MSGPKVDRVSIREREQIEIERERKNRRDCYNVMRQYIETIKFDSSYIEEIKKINNESCDRYIDEIKKNQEEGLEKINSLMEKVKRGNELLSVDDMINHVNEIYAEYERKTLDIKTIVNRMISELEDVDYLKKEQEDLISAKRIERNIKITNIDFDSVEEESQAIKEEKEKFARKIQKMLDDKTLFASHKNKVLYMQKCLNKTEYDNHNMKEKIRVKRLYNDFEAMAHKIYKELEEASLYYEDYCNECFDIDINVKQFSEFDSKEEIIVAIEDVSALSKKKLSMEYIKRQIDNVMIKHGYDILNARILDRVENKGDILYGIDDNTAINIFVSDDNGVTMRVVGVDFDGEDSKNTEDKMFRDQCEFCSMHEEITKELEMRGVILHTKKHMPPNKMFNKKLKLKNKNNLGNKNHRKKDLKRQQLKKMYKE